MKLAIIKKLADLKKSATTHYVGLLQARAYRILKKHTAKSLAKFHISTVDWAFLGLLYGEESGLRITMIGKQMGVSTPFVTTLVSVLEKKGLIDIALDKKDNRAKLIRLTPKGDKFVEEVESSLRKDVRYLVEGVSPRDLVGYLRVLKKIIDNSSKKS